DLSKVNRLACAAVALLRFSLSDHARRRLAVCCSGALDSCRCWRAVVAKPSVGIPRSSLLCDSVADVGCSNRHVDCRRTAPLFAAGCACHPVCCEQLRTGSTGCSASEQFQGCSSNCFLFDTFCLIGVWLG